MIHVVTIIFSRQGSSDCQVTHRSKIGRLLENLGLWLDILVQSFAAYSCKIDVGEPVFIGGSIAPLACQSQLINTG